MMHGLISSVETFETARHVASIRESTFQGALVRGVQAWIINAEQVSMVQVWSCKTIMLVHVYITLMIIIKLL